MKGAVRERAGIKTPEKLKEALERQVREPALNPEDRKTLEELSSRVVITKMDGAAVEGIYYAGSTGTLEEKDVMDAAGDIANITKLVHRTGRTVSLRHSEDPPPAPNDEGEQSLLWKSRLVSEVI